MGESIWKKEISFKRKPKDEAAPEAVDAVDVVEAVVADEPKQSVWKKDVSFSRKQKEPKAPKPAKAEGEPKQSVWKKDVSLGRKSKEPKAAQAESEPKQSLWKKDVSFSRKKKDDDAVQRLVDLATKTVAPDFDAALAAEPVAPPTQVAEAVVAAEPVVESADVYPVELLPVDEPVASVAEVVQPEPAPVYDMPAPIEPAPVVELPAATMYEVPQPVDPAPVEPQPAVEQPAATMYEIPQPVAPVDPQPVVEAPGAAYEIPQPVVEQPAATYEIPQPVVEQPAATYETPQPVAPVELQPVVEQPAATYETPQPIAPVELQPAVAYEAPQPVAYAEPAPHVEPAPVEQWMEPVAVESWLAEPELPPVPEAGTQVVVHPPVAAVDLPPLPDLKQPFWKKELSFGRKPKDAQATVAEPKQPFWKKELSLGRKSNAKQADASAVQAPVAAPGVHPPVPAAELPPLPDAKVPFWKKEIGGPKKAKMPKAPKEPKAAKTPRAKKGLSFSMPSIALPSFSKGGGHQVKRLVGLKVGGSQLAAARIANNGSAELLQLARVDLDPGVVVAGELRDVDSLANALKTFFAANKLPKKNVRLGIASNRIGVRTFDIAGISDVKQLENAIQFRAQEALPIPLDEAVLDFQILEERVDDEGNPLKRVLLVVAYRELVDRYVAACKKAGITLSGIDLEAFALLRALSVPRPEDQQSDAALVAVAIGHDRSTFAVSDGRVCEFTRVLEWGGASLNIAIARALDLAPSEAEGIKRVVSLSSPDIPQGIAPEHYALAVDAVRKQVQTFVRELVSSLQFYQNQPGSLGIGEIVITGGTANLAGLADELQRSIGVRVRVGDPLARLRVAKKIAVDEQLGSLAVAIGLGIED